MPSNTGRSAIRLATLILLALLVGGCGGDSASPTAAPATTTATTAAATTTTVPSLTAQELTWLKAVTRLRKNVEKVFHQSGITLTRAKMTQYADTTRACSRQLARIGSPSDRLEPVHVIVKKACRTFDKGAKCWTTAASVSMADGGVIAGTPEERTQSRAIECGGAAMGDGTNLLIEAEAKGKEIRAKYHGN